MFDLSGCCSPAAQTPTGVLEARYVKKTLQCPKCLYYAPFALMCAL